MFSKRNFFKRNQSKIFSIIIIVLILSLTIGFSAFQKELLVKDLWAVVRIKKDIRVTGISVNSSSNGGTSHWEEYDVSKIMSSVSMPNNTSTITFSVPITNIGNAEMGIFNITGLPSNLTYSISGYTLKDKLCDDNNHSKCSLGSVSTPLITISYAENGYDSNNTDYIINLDFQFERIYTITYHGLNTTTGLPTAIIEGDSKTITFTSTTGIPLDVSVINATGIYTSPTLSISNVIGNIDVYRKYSITYVLDGGTQAEGQPTMIAPNETITLLQATKDEYSFGGWYDNEELEGSPIATLENINNDITLYACWTQYDYFIKHKEFDGTVGNIIDTGIALYSTENVHRNFRIKFTIDSFDSSYPTANITKTAAPTILSSMNESGSPWPGFVYRLYTNGGATKYNVKINDSHVTSFEKFYTLNSGIDVEIVREDGVMYTKIDSDKYTEVLAYKSNIDTFNVPLTIGGNINENGDYDRLFKGTLSNVSVEFYEGNIINVDTPSYTEVKTANSYQLNGTIEFDGTNYIDTGLNLFSAENINKDFEISLTVNQVGGNSSQATLINFKDESQNNSWPGVSYRLKSNSSNFEFTARWPGKTTVSINDTTTPPKTISLARRSGIIYYSVNGAPESVLIETPPASLTNPINKNLTFGSSLNASGAPFRYFSGIVSDISVRLID